MSTVAPGETADGLAFSRSIVPVTLPANARPGTYRVIATVEARGAGKDVEETTFRVRQ